MQDQAIMFTSSSCLSLLSLLFSPSPFPDANSPGVSATPMADARAASLDGSRAGVADTADTTPGVRRDVPGLGIEGEEELRDIGVLADFERDYIYIYIYKVFE